MHYLIKNLILIAAILSINLSQGQDILYFTDGTKQQCKITSIDAQKVSYKNLENYEGPTYTKKSNQLLFAFKDTGKFLVLADNTNSAPVFIEFLENLESRPFDIIITKDNAVLVADSLSLDGDKFKYLKSQDEGKQTEYIEKEKIAAIIYRNGKHMLYMPSKKVALSLAQVKDDIDRLISTKATKDISVKEPVVATAKEMNVGLSKAELERFQFKAKEKTHRFGEYIALIGDKQSDREEQNKSIDAACSLFLSDTSTVEVSNVNREDKEKYTVRKYLQRLKLLPYNEVVITWTDVSYVSDLKLGADGNYYGVVSFQQVFEGYDDGNVVYRDVTQKNVEVILKSYQKEIDGEKKSLWDVFLSNVGVEETSK
ncbi:hypothetical protein ABID22_000898 [Pontibacter aydingkolensis]|uniref:Uncharacterized protein n=2 Tax=Pontibacter aydingkolensis TaxID=1911536 RepID=A0ABS7CSQ4_9BACT|nr:hypothetical protein [Pontibacter aydingkolensis]